MALLAKALDELEDLVRLGDAEGGRRLVEEHDLVVPQHGPGDRHGLALAAGQAGDQDPDARDLDREAPQDLDGLLLHRDLVEPAQRAARTRLATEVEVADDVEVVAQREVLVDGRDPERRRIGWTRDRDDAALPQERAFVGSVDAADQLDERRLAGAVVADQRDDLAGVDVELDVGQRLDRPEAFADPTQLE